MTEHAFKTGQTLLSDFKADHFKVRPDIQKGSPHGTYVTNFAKFFIVVQLIKDCQHMNFKVKAEATFKNVV